MAVEKYVVFLDADRDVTPQERDDVVGQLVEGADGAGAGLVGLTVSRPIESLTGPAGTVAVVQAWIDGSAGAGSGSVLGHLTGSVDAKVSSWRVEEIVFLAPVDRRPSGEHSRLNRATPSATQASAGLEAGGQSS